MYQDNKQKICATIEARMESSRLPGKVLLPLMGKPVLQHIIERLNRSQYIDEVIVATTSKKSDDIIMDFCHDIGCRVYRGEEENIVERLLGASAALAADVIVQATGDNPVIDHRIVDQMIALHFSNDFDYTCNNLEPSYPLGLDTRMFKRSALVQVSKLTQDPIDLVHGSYFIYRRPDLFKLGSFTAPEELSWFDLRLTLDEALDYKLIKTIFASLYPTNNDFTLKDVIQFLKKNIELSSINKAVCQKLVYEG